MGAAPMTAAGTSGSTARVAPRSMRRSAARMAPRPMAARPMGRMARAPAAANSPNAAYMGGGAVYERAPDGSMRAVN